jgi:DNA-binding phage protein
MREKGLTEIAKESILFAETLDTGLSECLNFRRKG